MANEIVVARGFRGQPFVVHVCGARRDIVFVTGETNYQHMRDGLPSVTPIGVRRSDVFLYDEATYNQLLANWRDNPNAWENLQQWNEAVKV